MRTPALVLCCAVTLAVAEGYGQSPFYPTPPRVLGQLPDPNTPGQSRSYAPNMVEGRELYSPQSVALDTTVSPPILYVADTSNNRVLAWRNALAANGATAADLIIGQPDRYATASNNPNLRTGLSEPSGLVVDAQGNLYVLDAGNNRVLRFPKPFQDTNDPKRPDAVLGQPDFSTRNANNGGVSAQSLNYQSGSAFLPGALLLDPAGNLYVTDTGNHRVLRYLKTELDQAANRRISADIVWGQADFTANSPTFTFSAAARFNTPTALAMDSTGRLFVSDVLSRILVFTPGFLSGQSAARIVGTLTPQGQIISPPTQTSFAVPQGLATAGNELYVVDTGNNRILKFDQYSQWPASEPPRPTAVIGQPGYVTSDQKLGSAGLNQPIHAVFSGSELFVADSGNSRVMVFPQGSNTASRILGQVSPDYGGANLVEGKDLFLASGVATSGGTILVGGTVALDTRATPPKLYISDTFNNRVLGFCDARTAKPGSDPDIVIGQPDKMQSRPNYNPDGSQSRNDTNLLRPVGLALDAQGHLYVADWGNSRVLRFPAPCDNRGSTQRANLVLGQANFTTRDTAASDRFMAEPYGLAFTPAEGFLAVSDRAHNRVLLFKKPDGGDFTSGQAASTVFGQPNFISTAATPASQQAPANGMNDPRYIAIDTSGRMYVADSRNRRILVLTELATSSNGSSAAIVVTQSGTGQAMGEPHGVYVSPLTGVLWVAPMYESRILRYPEYEQLSINGAANLAIGTARPGTGFAIDPLGNLWFADTGNRVALYVPPAEATDGGNFVRNRGLAPGMIATLWPGGAPAYSGQPFRGVETVGFDWFDPPLIPLPKTLKDTQVLLNGQPVPLYFVSSGQINFQVPQNAPQSGSAEFQVVKQSTGEILAAGMASMKPAQPAFLMHNDPPFVSGQVAALNAQDSPVSCNGPDGPAIPVFCPGGVRPARRGEVVSLYLIGAGVLAGMPEDGGQAQGANDNARNKLRVLIGTEFVPDGNVQFSGLAPGLIGAWQINVKIPDSAPPGQVPVIVTYRDVPSSTQGVPRTFLTIR